MEMIVQKAVTAALEFGRDKLALAGGVAANSLLRTMMRQGAKSTASVSFVPEPVLCTDNAAMIACAAYYRYREGYSDDLTLDACPVLDF